MGPVIRVLKLTPRDYAALEALARAASNQMVKVVIKRAEFKVKKS